MLKDHTDGLVQDCSNSSANTLGLLQSCTNHLYFLYGFNYDELCPCAHIMDMTCINAKKPAPISLIMHECIQILHICCPITTHRPAAPFANMG